MPTLSARAYQLVGTYITECDTQIQAQSSTADCTGQGPIASTCDKQQGASDLKNVVQHNFVCRGVRRLKLALGDRLCCDPHGLAEAHLGIPYGSIVKELL